MAANPHTTQAQFLAWSRSVRAPSRYPELQGIGFVVVVPAAELPAFTARVRTGRPAGSAPFTVTPAGARPFYCLGAVGISRIAVDASTGVDFCANDKTMLAARASGLGSYYPVALGFTTWLGINTPVYRGGTTPATTAARQRTFIGWLGEAINPNILLGQALEGHPGTFVSMRYSRGGSSVVFGSTKAAHEDAITVLDLHNGWTITVTGQLPTNGAVGAWTVPALAIGVSALSLLLGLLLFVLATGRVRALQLVDGEDPPAPPPGAARRAHRAAQPRAGARPRRADARRSRAAAATASRRRSSSTSTASSTSTTPSGMPPATSCSAVVGQRLGGRAARARHRRPARRRRVRRAARVGAPQRGLAELVAERLLEVLREPFELARRRALGRRSPRASASPSASATRADELLRDADFALYEAKARRQEPLRRCSSTSMQAAAHDRADARDRPARGARARASSSSLYQPIFDLDDQNVARRRGADPLAAPDARGRRARRLHPARRGERADRARSAAGCCARPAARPPAGSATATTVGISVNVSARQLDRDGLVGRRRARARAIRRSTRAR